MNKSNKINENSPEARQLTSEASQVFLNTLRPVSYRAAENLQAVVNNVLATDFMAATAVNQNVQITPADSGQTAAAQQLVRAAYDAPDLRQLEGSNG